LEIKKNSSESSNVFYKVSGLSIQYLYTEDEKGMERAIKELQAFYKKEQELPKARDFSTIRQAIVRNKWRSFGINSWNDLVRRAIGKVTVERGLYTPDEAGLKRAIGKLQEKQQQLKRLPKNNDPGLAGIKAAVNRGKWENLGIKKGKWNDLLQMSCGKINVEREIYTKDRNGLEKAKAKLKTFYDANNRYPRSTDLNMGSIITAINRKKWVTLGIKQWRDLFEYTFGFNLKISQKNPYEGEKGLKQGQLELLEFKKKHGRLPKYADKELNPIRHMVSSGKWNQWGIKKWNDLIFLTFKQVTYERGKYIGKQGLERAIKEVQVFQKNNNRRPKTRDKGMSSILKVIQRKKWVTYGIKNWTDLIRLALDKEI